MSRLIRKKYPRIRKVVIKGEALFEVDARKKGTSGKRVYRKQRLEAEQIARDIASDLLQEGAEGARVTPELRVAALRAEAQLAKHGRSISDAVLFYLNHLEGELEKQKSLTVAKLADAWLTSKKKKLKKGILRHKTVDGVKEATSLLKKHWGNLRIAELEKNTLKAYLDSLTVSQQRVFNLRSLFSQFFNWCIEEEFYSHNPLKDVEIEVPKKDVQILTVQHSQKLMRICEEKFPDLVVYFAVGLFAGLRPDEAKQLTWEKIDLEEKQITVLSSISKVKETRTVTIEDTLLKWLVCFGGERKGHIVRQKGFRTATEDVRIAIGYRLRKKNEKGPKWIGDILRHSYASYWLAIHKDRARLAEQMGNSIKMIKDHYKQIVKQSDAQAYWQILPAKATNEDERDIQEALNILED